MKIVRQEDPYGCGMACVAMLTKTDYFTSCRDLFRTKSGRGKLTFTGDLKLALRRARVSSGKRLVRFKKNETCVVIKTNAILKVRPRRGRKTSIWHWVVWDAKKKKILCPLKKPYKELKLYSYLPVYPD